MHSAGGLCVVSISCLLFDNQLLQRALFLLPYLFRQSSSAPKARHELLNELLIYILGFSLF